MTDQISVSYYSMTMRKTLHIGLRSYAGSLAGTAVSSLETHGIQVLDVETYDYIPSRLFESFP